MPPHDVPTKPSLVRWDLNQPLTTANCCVMDSQDADKHFTLEKGPAMVYPDPVSIWGPDAWKAVQRAQKELADQKEWLKW